MAVQTTKKRGFGAVITPWRILVSVALAGCVAALWWTIQPENTPDHKPVALPRGVLAIEPPAGDLDLRQARISAQLATGYTGVLVVDGAEIPEDQLVRPDPTSTAAPTALAGLNTVSYTPGPGTITGALSPGRHCAAIVYWSVGQPRSGAVENRYPWCFQVH